MAHVFISYAQVDGDFVSLLKLELEKAGFEAWIDTERLHAGDDWRQGIDDAVRAAFTVIVVMSPGAFESKYVTYEWAFALGIGIKVIPIILVSTELHPRLEALQYLDFTNQISRPWDKLIQRLQQINSAQSDRNSIGSGSISTDVISQISTTSEEQANSISYLLNNLRDPSEKTRLTTVKQLGSLRSLANQDMIVALVLALHDHSANVQAEAAKVLGKIGHEMAIPGLLDALRDEHSYVRNAVASALVQIGDAAVSGLVQALHDSHHEVWVTAAQALGQIGRTAIPGLLDSLHDKSANVREYAIIALRHMGAVEALPQLVDALRDPAPNVRRVAVSAIGLVGDATIVPILMETMQQDKDESVCSNAATALGRIGGPVAVSSLLEVLSKVEPMRVNAAQALGQIGDTKAVPGLLAFLHDDNPKVVKAIIKALGQLGDSAVIPQLLDVMSDTSRQNTVNNVNNEVQHALIGFGHPAVSRLIESLSDTRPTLQLSKRVCDIVAEALTRIGTPEALAAVEQWRRGQS